MFIPPKYEGNGLIKDSRRIEIFFRRDGLAQRYLLKMRLMDGSSKKEYQKQLISTRVRREKIGYDRGRAQYAEFSDGTGLIPQIEEKFRSILIAETEGCEERRKESLSRLSEQFKTYLGLIEFDMMNAIPPGMFAYKA